MEPKQSSGGATGSVPRQPPKLSRRYPWVVSQGADEDTTRDQYFYTLHDPLTAIHCQIPLLFGTRIRGSYHGWVILSERLQNQMWYLWNPDSSRTITLPCLTLKDGDYQSIRDCCLSAPPQDPSSVLLLTRTSIPTFVFLHLQHKPKSKKKWVEMSYSSQLKSMLRGSLLHKLTCCNGKIYALAGLLYSPDYIIEIDIKVKHNEVLIKLSLLGSCPDEPMPHLLSRGLTNTHFLKGHMNELFVIMLYFRQTILEAVHLVKLNVTIPSMYSLKSDMSSLQWVDLLPDESWVSCPDIIDDVMFVDIAREDNMVYYRQGIASKLGGYVHFRNADILYSYHTKQNTVALSYMPMPPLALSTSLVSFWDCRLQDHPGGTFDTKQEKHEIVVRSLEDNILDESELLNLPFDMLEMILKHCLCVEYLHFRATCKDCVVAAPLIQWSNKTCRRLETYSGVSPWLMVVDEKQGIITFTDPLLGDKYFIKTPSHVSFGNGDIYCSRYGWLLFLCSQTRRLVLYNPFTTALYVLPEIHYCFNAACFSAPPTSPDCIVVGYSIGHESPFLIHHIGEYIWEKIIVDSDIPIHFLTFFEQDLVALDRDGKLVLFQEGEDDRSSWVAFAEDKLPVTRCLPPRYHYLMKLDEDLVKVIVGKFGQHIEVYKWDISAEKWEKMVTLRDHMIYICGTTCLCIQAKTRAMENKIYFPILHSENNKVVYYSLKTRTYETFDGQNIQQHLKDFFGTTRHMSPHAWIEPSWLKHEDLFDE